MTPIRRRARSIEFLERREMLTRIASSRRVLSAAAMFQDSADSPILAFSVTELEALRASIDRIIPPDEWPGGWNGGVRRLLAEHAEGFLKPTIPRLRAAIESLDRRARDRYGRGFSALAVSEQDGVLEQALVAEGGGTDGEQPVARLISLAFQGFYGGTREPAGWEMVGYSAAPDDAEALDPDPLEETALGDLRAEYDVVIVGAGAGGGVAAAELAAANLQVLVVERARRHRDIELRGNHLQGKRQALYDVTAGAGAGSPRVLERPDGTSVVLPGDGSGESYGLNAMTAGGGTRLWQGMAWRFLPEDFAMASTYGVPGGSTLADWPIGYEELERYYDRVEWELGVSGDADSEIGRRTRRSRPYPMPPLPGDATRAAFTRSADRLGIHASPIPFAINSVPRDGRPACVRCAQCVGHTCPVNAKNGSHNTFLHRAIATGNCSLLFSAQATAITSDAHGSATGVSLMVDTADGPVLRSVRARRVVVAAGAIESPRLILASGLGNTWVGRNLHSHGVALVFSYDAPELKGWTGPGHSVASMDWLHRDGEGWGGGVMFDMPPWYPLGKAEFGRQFAGVSHGTDHKRWMRDTGSAIGAMSMVQEVPHAMSRVMLDSHVTDRYGMPVARIREESHEASRQAVAYMVDRCEQWVAGIGAERIVKLAITGGSRGGEHAAGTVRFGVSPEEAACDERGILYGSKNVYVADGSLHPTNGGVNPTLTLMANAMRIASLMLEEVR